MHNKEPIEWIVHKMLQVNINHNNFNAPDSDFGQLHIIIDATLEPNYVISMAKTSNSFLNPNLYKGRCL